MMRTAFFGAALMLGLQSLVTAQQNHNVCEETGVARSLDFWLGEWKVYDQQNNLTGHNRIEKELSGCAVFEHWTGLDGPGGKSLFYFDAANQSWHQVWVTPFTDQPGGLKRKDMIEEFGNGGVRFEGRVLLPNGDSYLDRTTLTPNKDGKVRQVIEFSQDEGENWEVSFDATYVPKRE